MKTQGQYFFSLIRQKKIPKDHYLFLFQSNIQHIVHQQIRYRLSKSRHNLTTSATFGSITLETVPSSLACMEISPAYLSPAHILSPILCYCLFLRLYLIATFLPSRASLPVPTCPFPLSFKFMTSFPTHGEGVHMCVCVYICTPKDNRWIHIMLLSVCFQKGCQMTASNQNVPCFCSKPAFPAFPGGNTAFSQRFPKAPHDHPALPPPIFSTLSVLLALLGSSHTSQSRRTLLSKAIKNKSHCWLNLSDW